MPIRALGLAAVMLSVVLLVTALVGGITGGSPNTGAVASPAAMEPAKHQAVFTGSRPVNDENPAANALAGSGAGSDGHR